MHRERGSSTQIKAGDGGEGKELNWRCRFVVCFACHDPVRRTLLGIWRQGKIQGNRGVTGESGKRNREKG